MQRKRKEEKALKEKKRLEQIKYLADLERAKNFYHGLALRNGLKKFKNLIAWKIHNEKLSVEFRRQMLCRCVFKRWEKYAKNMWQARKFKADTNYNHHCMSIAYERWKNYCLVEHSKQLLADDWYDMKITEKILRIWIQIRSQTQMIFEIKWKKAQTHHDWYGSTHKIIFSFSYYYYYSTNNNLFTKVFEVEIFRAMA